MIVLPRPSRINGDSLRKSIEAKGYTDVAIFVLPDEIRIQALDADGNEITQDAEETVAPVVSSHTGEDSPRVNRNQKTIDDLASATTVAQIKAALIRHFTERGV